MYQLNLTFLLNTTLLLMNISFIIYMHLQDTCIHIIHQTNYSNLIKPNCKWNIDSFSNHLWLLADWHHEKQVKPKNCLHPIESLSKTTKAKLNSENDNIVITKYYWLYQNHIKQNFLGIGCLNTKHSIKIVLCTFMS